MTIDLTEKCNFLEEDRDKYKALLIEAAKLLRKATGFSVGGTMEINAFEEKPEIKTLMKGEEWVS